MVKIYKAIKRAFSAARSPFGEVVAFCLAPLRVRGFLFSLFFLINITPGLAEQDGREEYVKACRFIKQREYDFAFLEFRSIIRDFPDSRYARESEFAIGEYLFMQKMYWESIKNFSEYIRDYPDSNGAIFAKAYILKIMEDIENLTAEQKKDIENIKTELFSEPLFLLFSEYKEISYRSAFNNNFSIRYYVDIIKVYKNDKIFVTVTP